MAEKNTQGMKNNMILVLGVGLVLGFALGFMYNKVQMLEKGTANGGTQPAANPNAAAPQPATVVKITKPDAKTDHWTGNKNARFVHVEYSDFECPFCRSYVETLKQVEKEYGTKLSYIYRQYPLSFHPKAQKAAEASECAAELGGNTAFWKMHDKMFEAMPALELTQLGDLAQSIGLNKAAFQTCLDSGKKAAIVKAQLDEGTKAGVGATPTSVVYDTKTGESITIEGALPFENVKQMIDAFMKKQGA